MSRVYIKSKQNMDDVKDLSSDDSTENKGEKNMKLKEKLLVDKR